MQLIIPMSGIGQRFIKSGYKIPKPLIKLKVKILLIMYIKCFLGIDSVIFICNKNHLQNSYLGMLQEIKKLIKMQKF